MTTSPTNAAGDLVTGTLAYRFAKLSEHLRSVETLPAVGDLFYAIKNDGEGTGWRYTVSSVTAEDIHAAARALAASSAHATGAAMREGLDEAALAKAVDAREECGTVRAAVEAYLTAVTAHHPLPISCAPRDGTMVRLLIDFEGVETWCPMTDDMQSWTVGFNHFDHDEQDEWIFVGWDWSQDCIVDCRAPGHGKVIGWLPFAALSSPAQEGEAAPVRTDADGDDDTDANWMDLALQFDGQRILALQLLRAMVAEPGKWQEEAAEFVKAPPLSGEKVLAARLAALKPEDETGPAVTDAIDWESQTDLLRVRREADRLWREDYGSRADTGWSQENRDCYMIRAALTLAALKSEGETGPAVAVKPLIWIGNSSYPLGLAYLVSDYGDQFLAQECNKRTGFGLHDTEEVARQACQKHFDSVVQNWLTALTVSPFPSERDQHQGEPRASVAGGAGDDHPAFLRKWARDIRASSGQSVDADRLDAIADTLAVQSPPKPLSEADKREKTSLWWFLHILAACGEYGASATDYPDEWVSAFCDDSEPTDTLNTALNLKLAGWSHDSRTEAGRIWITDAGRAWLAAALSTPEAVPVADKREGAK